MIPHRQEYPLRTTVCPSLPIDGRHARSPRFCLVEVRNHARWAYRGLISATMFRGPVRLQPRASRTRVTPWNGWLCQMCMVIDRPRPRSTCSAGAGEEVFSFLHLDRCCGFLTSRSQLRFVAVVGENDSLSSFSRQSQTGVLQLLEPFFAGSRFEEEGAEAHGPEDRPSAGRFSFFLLPWNCLQFVLKAFSFSRQALVGLLLQYTRNPRQTGRKRSDRARTAVHRPWTRWSRFWFWERIFSWTADLITFVLRQATVGTLLCDRMILLFSKKPLKKWRKLPPHRNKRPKTKKKNEPSWSPFDCVTSRVTQQHSRRYFQLDLTMSCRESMLQLQLQFSATRGTRASVPAICHHERDVKNKAREI